MNHAIVLPRVGSTSAGGSEVPAARADSNRFSTPSMAGCVRRLSFRSGSVAGDGVNEFYCPGPIRLDGLRSADFEREHQPRKEKAKPPILETSVSKSRSV